MAQWYPKLAEYDFEGFIFFDENEIGVRQLKVVDKRENLAFLNGGVFHDGFTNFILDISIVTRYKDLKCYGNNERLLQCLKLKLHLDSCVTSACE